MSIRTYTEQDIVDAFAQTGLAPVRRTWAHHLRGDERIPCGCALVALAQAAGLDTATINHNATDYASALDSSIRPHLRHPQRLGPRRRGDRAERRGLPRRTSHVHTRLLPRLASRRGRQQHAGAERLE